MKKEITKDLFDLQENYQTEPGERQVDLEIVIDETETATTKEDQ
jgi:hypothetical protein